MATGNEDLMVLSTPPGERMVISTPRGRSYRGQVQPIQQQVIVNRQRFTATTKGLQPKLAVSQFVWEPVPPPVVRRKAPAIPCDNQLQGELQVQNYIINLDDNRELWYSKQWQDTLRCYINFWLSSNSTREEDARLLISSLELLGSSTFGTAYSADFAEQPGPNAVTTPGFVLVKAPISSSGDPYYATELIHEYNIAFGFNGQGTNSLRSRIPTFTYIYDLVTCQAPVPRRPTAEPRSVANLWCTRDEPVAQILEEQVPGRNVNSYLIGLQGDTIKPDEFSTSDYVSVYLQLLYALYYAGGTIGFAHNDLSSNNVVLRPLDTMTNLVMPRPPLRNNATTSVPTRFVAQIIDYGLAQITRRNANGALLNDLTVGMAVGSIVYDAFFFLLHSSLTINPPNPATQGIYTFITDTLAWFTDVPVGTLGSLYQAAKGNVIPMFMVIDPSTLVQLITRVENYAEKNGLITADSELPIINSAAAPALTNAATLQPQAVTVHILRRWYDILRPVQVFSQQIADQQVNVQQVIANSAAQLSQYRELLERQRNRMSPVYDTTEQIKSRYVSEEVTTYLHIAAIYDDTQFLLSQEYFRQYSRQLQTLIDLINLPALQALVRQDIQAAELPATYSRRLISAIGVRE